MLVVAVAMLGSLTVLPAVLSRSATSIEAAASRSSAPPPRTAASGRIWGAILDRVLRHPVVSAVAAAAVLVALATAGAAAAHGAAGLDALPKSLEAIRPSTRSRRRSPAARPGGRGRPAPTRPPPRAGRDRRLSGRRRVRPDARADHRRAGPRRHLPASVPLAGDGTDAVSEHALAHPAHEIVPADGRRGARRARTPSPAAPRSPRLHDDDEANRRRRSFGFVLLLRLPAAAGRVPLDRRRR